MFKWLKVKGRRNKIEAKPVTKRCTVQRFGGPWLEERNHLDLKRYLRRRQLEKDSISWEFRR